MSDERPGRPYVLNWCMASAGGHCLSDGHLGCGRGRRKRVRRLATIQVRHTRASAEVWRTLSLDAIFELVPRFL